MGLQPETHRYILAAIFMVTGLLHFLKPNVFVAIMPDYIPYHLGMVYLSGVAEILGAIGILFPTIQLYAGWGLILLLIAVFPANINMAADAVQNFGYQSLYTWMTLLRLPMQFVFIYWVYWSCLEM